MSLPTNSSIKIDDVTINANASIVFLWEKAIGKAIESGKVGWVRLFHDGGMEGVLVTPSSRVRSFISSADLPERAPDFGTDHSTNSNLHAWAARYIHPGDDGWEMITALGMVDEVSAARADLAHEAADRVETDEASTQASPLGAE